MKVVGGQEHRGVEGDGPSRWSAQGLSYESEWWMWSAVAVRCDVVFE